MRKHDRCPWCGRKIEIPSNPFKNTACKWCGKKYYTYFRYVFGIVLCTPLLLFVKPSSPAFRLALLIIVVLAFLALIPLAYGGRLKLMRNSPSDVVVDIPTIYVASIVSRSKGNERIKNDDILLTHQSFDEIDASAVSAPIRVVATDKKSIRFYFLYKNKQTEMLIEQGKFDVYSGESKKNSGKKTIYTLELAEGEHSEAMSDTYFANYGYRNIDESKIVGIDSEGISYFDENGVKQTVRYSECVTDEKAKQPNCIGKNVIISELICGVVLYTTDMWTLFVFSERNRAQALSMPNTENRYSRRQALVREIEKNGYTILNDKF